MADHDFLDDVRTLRERAKESLDDGAVTVGYGCDVKQSIALLRTVVATESVCVLRYTMHSIASERSVIEHYRELIRHFADKDPTTRVMLEDILAEEEDHATDTHDLLVAHEGKQFTSGDIGRAIREVCAPPRVSVPIKPHQRSFATT